MNINKKGFTLVELMIVIGIIGLMTVMLSWQIIGSKSEKKAEIDSLDLMNARKAMKFTVSELRNAEKIQSLGEHNVEYISSDDGNKYNLLLEGNDLKKVETNDFNENKISEIDIFDLTVSGKKGNIIKIKIKSGNVDLSTSLFLRN